MQEGIIFSDCTSTVGEYISFHLTFKEIWLYVMPLKSDLSEEAIWGPQNILITLAILLCYYHNYPFAPDVLIRNSPLAPRGWKEPGLGGMLKLGKGISQLLPYAFWNGKYMRGGGCSQCYWNMKLSHPTSLLCLSLTSLSFKVHLHPSLLPLIPHLPILLTHLRPLHPSVLYLAFCLTISCDLLFSRLFFHLRATLLFPLNFNILASSSSAKFFSPSPPIAFSLSSSSTV